MKLSNKLLVIVYVFIFLVSGGCTQVNYKVAKTVSGSKSLHVVLANDPALITMDLKSVLNRHGIKSSFSSEEVKKEVLVQKSDNKSFLYNNVTDSPYRYQMKLLYLANPVSNLVSSMSAEVYDSDSKEIIAKYSVRLIDWQLNTEEASERLYQEFLSKIFID